MVFCSLRRNALASPSCCRLRYFPLRPCCFGAPDVLDIPFVTRAGGAVFDTLALLFSIGIAVGLAKDSNGAAGLAGCIGYLILTTARTAIDATLNMSVFAGIISGIEGGILTGITEPIEFLFMFVAPSLYVIHALLTGLSLSVTYSLGVLDAGAFSPGFIDYVLSWGLATKPWLIIPIGLGIGAVYYVVFSWMIRRFDIPTVGRCDEGIEASADAEKLSDFSKQILTALGGTANLAEVSNCITRLRIVVIDSAKVDHQALKSIPGVKGIIGKDKAVQVVIGLQAEHIANEIKEEMKR